jgi:hypothetical protein
MKLHPLEVVSVPLNEIDQHPDNANNGDVDALEQSIEVNGFYSPIIVQASTGYIIAGNHRYLVATKLEMATIPVIYLDVDDLEAKRIMVADNRITRLGFDDEAQLLELLEDLKATDAGLSGTGYNFDDFTKLEKLISEPLDLADEPEMEPVGEHMGKHLNYTLMPVIEEDGKVYRFDVSKPSYKHLTANDFNVIRKAFGQQPLSREELDTYDVDDWKR